MQLHQLQPQHKNKNKKRVGRGGKRGTYSGRGIKGQKARAGRKIRPQSRDAIKKIPKKRGASAKRFREKPVIINIRDLEKSFKSGEKINPATLRKVKIIKSSVKKSIKVKILSKGKLSKKLNIANCYVSDKARDKIIKAGGKVK